MAFYETPAFFILLAIAAVPAIVLGCLGKPIRRYGFVVSIVFLALLFSRDLYGLACSAFFTVWSTALVFYVKRLFEKEDARAIPKYCLCVILAIAPLAIYKVSAVFDANLLGFLGISYATFKVVQVIIELRDRTITELSLFSFLYFLFFFAPFTSGPIMRSRKFEEDISSPIDPAQYRGMLYRGLGFIIVGSVYKYVLAALSSWAMWFVPSVIGDASVATAAGAQYVQGWGYTLYMFFDFAGYSLMAVGAGCIFGVHVPMNFDAPFRSLDMKDFWNRWHISLSSWLRDYVFMRIARSCLKHKTFKSRTTVACIGFMANMVLMGVWHGITPDYIVYGFYHGILLALTELFQKKSKFYKTHRKDTWFKMLSWVITMHLVMIGLAIFSGQAAAIIMAV